MKKNPLSVSIVIPNWNGGHLLVKNLPYVLISAPKAEIIVADDASADDSITVLREQFPEIKRIENKKHQGFSGNVNSGVAAARGDIVVLLNTDVRPEKDFLVPLLSRFTDPNVAAVGCLEKSHEKDAVVLRGRGIARWEKGFFIHSKGEINATDTAWVSGGSSAYRRSVWNELGGMDTIYNPFYWEDIDLSYQMLKSGYSIRFEPKSIVHHFHEEGKIKTSYTSDEVKRIVYRNQFIFLWKNISDIHVWVEYCLWMPIRLMQAMLRYDSNMIFGYLMVFPKALQVQLSRMKASSHWKRRDTDIFSS